MSIQIVVDMNLSPAWVPILEQAGWPAVHWAAVGDPRALDPDIMSWALGQGYVVFTHDLDFGGLLALTHAAGPSVVLLRTDDTLPDRVGNLVVAVLKQYEAELEQGALVVIDRAKQRIRILPI
jgi:predicted nuclease of predicted toxin-antitoxin system